MQSWAEQLADIAHLNERQLFFVGGAPRSGTTWLQQMLDSHPEVSCQGEGLFQKQLAEPLERLVEERRKALAAKNTALFHHTGGYPLPEPSDVECLLGTAVLLALRRQCLTKPCRAIGEKTPENVFLFSRLKRMFPNAKLIAIARDPRDVLTSAWHFFRKPVADEDEVAAKVALIRTALPSVAEGARVMIELAERNTRDCMLITYEALQAAPEPVLAKLFRFLNVSDSEAMVADCVARTSFATMTGGRPAGVAANGSFFRKGVVGDWQSTLTPEMNDMILHELGWMFPYFGWKV